MTKVTFIEETEYETIEHGGYTFETGVAVELPEDAILEPWFIGNPSFKVEKTEKKAPEVKQPTKEELRAALTEKGVKIKGNPSVTTLTKMLEEANK